MLTSPITTPHFQTSVLNLVSTYRKTVDSAADPSALPVPLVPALKPIDSTLIPSDTISQLLITTSSWIDLASPDPVIANVSQQVFNLEVAYAAFCGVQHVVVQGPTLGNGSLMCLAMPIGLSRCRVVGPRTAQRFGRSEIPVDQAKKIPAYRLASMSESGEFGKLWTPIFPII